ncbi:MAG: PEGA domain-containing protein [Bryobacterales bacterium]|nr:PEGA domain-containing protein [Bryobacterales bacterium]
MVEPDNRNRLQNLLLEVSQRLAVGDDEKALQSLEEVLRLDPANQHAILSKTQIHLRQGGTAFQQKRYSEVRRHLHHVLQMQTVSQRAHRLLRQVSVAEDRHKRLGDKRSRLLDAIQQSREYGHFEVAVKCVNDLLQLEQDLGIPDSDTRALQEQLDLELRLMHEAERRLADAIAKKSFADGETLCDRALERWPKANRFLVHRVDIEAASFQTTRELRSTLGRITDTARLMEQKGLYRNALMEWELAARISPGLEEAAQQQKLVGVKLAEQEWEESIEAKLDRLQELWASEDYIGAESALREIARQAPNAPNLDHWRHFIERARHFALEEQTEATRRVREALDCYDRDPKAAAKLLIEADSLDNYHPLTEPLLRQLRWLEPDIGRDGTLGRIEAHQRTVPVPAPVLTPPQRPPAPAPNPFAGDPLLSPPPASIPTVASMPAVTSPPVSLQPVPPQPVNEPKPASKKPATPPPVASAPEASKPKASGIKASGSKVSQSEVSSTPPPPTAGSSVPPTSPPAAQRSAKKASALPFSPKWLVLAGVVAVLAGVSPELINSLKNSGQKPSPSQPAPSPEPPKPVEPAKPLVPSLRVISELPLQFKLDGQAVADVQAGGGPLDNLTDGKHVLEITNQGMKEVLNFEVAGRVVTLPPAVRPAWVDAVVMARQATGWRLMSSAPAGEVFVDEQPAGKLPLIEALPLADGERKMRIQIDATQKVEQQIGVRESDVMILWLRPLGMPLLTITSNVDRVQVFLNGRFWGPTMGRQLSIWRIPPGKQRIRVQKDGYQSVPEQEATIAAGKTQNVKFELVPLPKLATLQVQTDGAGYQIRVDGRTLGETDANGRFESKTLEPGDHRFEIAKQGYRSRTFDKRLVAGDTLSLGRADTRLDLLQGTVRLTYAPNNARVVARRLEAGGAERAVTAGEVQLAPGPYEFTATANGFRPRTVRVVVESGRAHDVNLQLEVIAVPAAPKPVAPVSVWEGGVTFTDRGDGFASPPANVPYVFVNGGAFTGTIRFTVDWEMRRNMTWLTHFKDFQNFVRWELNNRELNVTVVQNGKGKSKDQKHRIKDLASATVRLNIQAESVQLSLDNPAWKAEPVAVPAGMTGKFGFSTNATKFFIKDFQATR